MGEYSLRKARECIECLEVAFNNQFHFFPSVLFNGSATGTVNSVSLTHHFPLYCLTFSIQFHASSSHTLVVHAPYITATVRLVVYFYTTALFFSFLFFSSLRTLSGGHCPVMTPCTVRFKAALWVGPVKPRNSLVSREVFWRLPVLYFYSFMDGDCPSRRWDIPESSFFTITRSVSRGKRGTRRSLATVFFLFLFLLLQN